jgi:hypothetical protein
MILGLGDPVAFKDCLMSLANREPTACQICLLRLPLAETTALRDPSSTINLNAKVETIAFQGLFVPLNTNSGNTLSYVDVVQKLSPKNAPDEKKKKQAVLAPTAMRKVSNASTVSTQAEDEWTYGCSSWDHDPSEQHLHLRVNEKTQKHRSQADFEGPDPDFFGSELSQSTTKRKTRMDGRRKDSLAKKIDIGLLATMPCPREEPDRSPLQNYQAKLSGLLSFIRNLPEKPCNKFYLSQCLFSACQYSHEYEFSEKQVSAMAWIVKSSPCPEWDTCTHGENCIYGHV